MPFPTLQDLSPPRAHFCLHVERFFLETLPDTLSPDRSHFLLALSGGADSTALAAIFRLLSPRLGCTLSAAHLDHAIRPESGGDALAVRALCTRLDLPLHESRQDVPAMAREAGTGLEEAGRVARQRFFREVSDRIGADLVLTGHHLDDLAEDMLMRLIRGTGWPTLAGMRAHVPECRTARPLLLTPRQSLRDLCLELELRWVEDESNRDPSFLRNRIRHQVMPLLLAENPRLQEQFAGLWRLGMLDREYWDGQCSRILEQVINDTKPSQKTLENVQHADKINIELPDGLLAGQPRALRLRLFKECLERLGPGQPLMANLLALDEAWLSGVPGKTVQFPGAKEARILRGAIRFTRA